VPRMNPFSRNLLRRTVSAEDKALADENSTEAGNAVQETQAFLNRYELVLPKAVRRLISDLRKAMLLSTDDLGWMMNFAMRSRQP